MLRDFLNEKLEQQGWLHAVTRFLRGYLVIRCGLPENLLKLISPGGLRINISPVFAYVCVYRMHLRRRIPMQTSLAQGHKFLNILPDVAEVSK